MRPLRDVRIVDLNKSILDEKASDRDKDIYVFKKKVYVGKQIGKDFKKMRDDVFQFKWGRDPMPGMGLIPENTPNLWAADFGATYVTPEDGYWPELFTRDANGHYKYPNGDAVLVKIPLEKYIEKRKEDIETHEAQLKSTKEAMDRHLTKTDKQMIADNLGRKEKEDRERLGI
ncbi:MAG: hypothetical protein ACYTFW_23040 [Planctomycetota bacterium]|jgi:hypothetical protein